MPEPFLAIGIHYVDFHQISDDEVIRLLAEHSGEAGSQAPRPAG
jgi:predicted phosphoribosyltransferase